MRIKNEFGINGAEVICDKQETIIPLRLMSSWSLP